MFVSNEWGWENVVRICLRASQRHLPGYYGKQDIESNRLLIWSKRAALEFFFFSCVRIKMLAPSPSVSDNTCNVPSSLNILVSLEVHLLSLLFRGNVKRNKSGSLVMHLFYSLAPFFLRKNIRFWNIWLFIVPYLSEWQDYPLPTMATMFISSIQQINGVLSVCCNSLI